MKISIIIPVYNEEKLINDCLDSLVSQNYPKEDYEIIIVNDGSTDNTKSQISRPLSASSQANGGQANLKSKISTPEIRLINLEKNKGWIIARETGAKNARYENLLFIDSRCVADSEILNNLKKINYQPLVGNPVMNQNKSIFDRFGFLFRKKLYGEYFREDFKPVYITPNNYDDIPKGTTVLFCDKRLFISSQPENKGKWISDDIKLLRNIALKKPLLKHPDIKVIYQSRDSFKSVFRHIFKRGPRFVDYYLNPKKKYFWLFIIPSIMAFPIIIFMLIKPIYFIYFLAIVILMWISASLWLAENIKDFAISLILLPLFAISFWVGIFYGLTLKLFRKY